MNAEPGTITPYFYLSADFPTERERHWREEQLKGFPRWLQVKRAVDVSLPTDQVTLRGHIVTGEGSGRVSWIRRQIEQAQETRRSHFTEDDINAIEAALMGITMPDSGSLTSDLRKVEAFLKVHFERREFRAAFNILGSPLTLEKRYCPSTLTHCYRWCVTLPRTFRPTAHTYSCGWHPDDPPAQIAVFRADLLEAIRKTFTRRSSEVGPITFHGGAVNLQSRALRLAMDGDIVERIPVYDEFGMLAAVVSD